MKVFGRLWAGAGFALTLFGIFWLPKDVADWKIAAQPWQDILSLTDQNTALWCFAIVSLLYICWMDIRPWAQSRWRDRRTSTVVKENLAIDFPSEINCHTKYGPNKRSTTYILKSSDNPFFLSLSEYFVGIKNVSNNTIHNVSAVVHLVENPIKSFPEKKLLTADGHTKLNIAPGYVAYFKIGHHAQMNSNFLSEQILVIEKAQFDKIQSQLNADEKSSFGFVIELDDNEKIYLLKNDGLRLRLGVYGDDINSSCHQFILNCKTHFNITYEGEVNSNEYLAPRPKVMGIK